MTPAPYAIFATTASNLLGVLPTSQLNGTVANAQLANNSITVNTGADSAAVAPLGGSRTLTNTGVLSVTGNSDITASTSAGAVTLGDTATSANVPNTIVKRDASGNFSPGIISANLIGNATLASNVPSGIAIIIDITNAFITNSVFAGNGSPHQPQRLAPGQRHHSRPRLSLRPVVCCETGLALSGSFSGNGSSQADLTAANSPAPCPPSAARQLDQPERLATHQRHPCRS